MTSFVNELGQKLTVVEVSGTYLFANEAGNCYVMHNDYFAVSVIHVVNVCINDASHGGYHSG